MRKLLILAGLVAVVALAASTGMTPPAQATTMCTTTCSGSTLSCTPVSSCTSVPGTSITCDGVTTQCSASNSWCACANQCETNFEDCNFNCDPSVPVTCRICARTYNTCISHCGTQPPHSSC